MLFALVLSSLHIQAQYIVTYAGNGYGAGSSGTGGYTGDGGPDYLAEFNMPIGVATYGYTNVYIADMGNHVVRKVNNIGIISTLAGTGVAGYTKSDTSAATNVKLTSPHGLAVDGVNNVYFSDQDNNVVYKVSAVTGIITVVAGSDSAGYSGDGGAAIHARLNHPLGIALDAAGNLFIADALNNVIRKVTPGGAISTIVGTGYGAGLSFGHGGYTGDKGPASAAKLNYPSGVAVDVAGDIFIADVANNVIRMVNTKDTISTYAGNGVASFGGDGGAAVSAMLDYPTGVAVDGPGNVYIADQGNNNVREVNTSGIINTIAGIHSSGYFGDGHLAVNAQLNSPASVAVDGNGLVYIADMSNNVIRLVGPSTIVNAVPQVAGAAALKVFPDPSAGSFTVSVPGTRNGASIAVVDMVGNVVATRNVVGTSAQNVTFALSALAAGNYIVRVDAGDATYRAQVVILPH